MKLEYLYRGLPGHPLHPPLTDATIGKSTPFVLTVAGYLMLTVGGWLGGSVVFVHGMRVLNLVQEPTRRAASPVRRPEQEAAERS